ncbi:MAG: DNA primase [Rhodospirillaceae bacterium]
MTFPPAFLEELRARLPLSEVVGKRLRLVRAGREFHAPCPFHNEKTPSFTVNDQKGFFHCFGCGAHGDVVGFAMRHDHLTFPEAVELLASQAGLQVPLAAPEDRKRFEREKSLHEVVEATTRWFELQLRAPWGAAALAYARQRGLDDETIAAFRLGYAPQSGGALPQALAREGYNTKDMLDAGVIKPSKDNNGPPYSFFRNRIIFPVSDRRGRVVAFGGRLIEGDGPKYINTGETPLFHKGQLLYGLSRARQAAAEGKAVIVVEGYMDVIALVRAGFPGAVAPLGTALTETQIGILWAMIPGREKLPVLCFDGDNAGKRAAERAVERILPMLVPDQSARVAFLPSGEDPDSLIRTRGVAVFASVLAAARPLVDVLWEIESTGRSFDTPEAKAGLKATLDARVNQIADKTVQGFYRIEIRRRIGEAFTSKPVRMAPPPKSNKPWRPNRPDMPRPPPVAAIGGPQQNRPRAPAWVWQRTLLATLINHPQLLGDYHEILAMTEMTGPGLDDLRHALIGCGHDILDGGGAMVRSHLGSMGFARILDDLLSSSTYSYAAFATCESDPEAARRGLTCGCVGLWRKRISQELWEAGRRLNQDGSQQNLSRFYTLNSELAGSARGMGDE